MKRSRIYMLTLLVVLFTIGLILPQFQNNIYSAKSTLFAWAGDTKISNGTIGIKENKMLEYKLCPGDIILTRNKGYVSNLFIPGFWTHAGIYLGNANLRSQYFKGRFDNSIPKNFDVIEALSEGVVFSTFYKSSRADNIAILRPTISKSEIEKVIEQALAQVNKSYDFNFNLNSDSLIYCTELIYQTYLPFVDLPTKKIFGRTCITANDLYKCTLFDCHHKSKLNLVYMDKVGNQNSKVELAI